MILSIKSLRDVTPKECVHIPCDCANGELGGRLRLMHQKLQVD